MAAGYRERLAHDVGTEGDVVSSQHDTVWLIRKETFATPQRRATENKA